MVDNSVSPEVDGQSDPWHMVNGIYKGSCEGHSLTFEMHTRPVLKNERLENPYGFITFGADKNRLEFICFKTNSPSKYEVRIKRPSNPALLGEYLTLRAYIEVQVFYTLKLTVVEGLSKLELAKYKLPSQGVSCKMELSKVCA